MNTLLAAYHNSIYQVDQPLWQLHIGGLHPAFDRWLQGQGVRSWGFITAYNPFSDVLTLAENARRLERLHYQVCRAGYCCYMGRGQSADPTSTWEPEISLLVLGLTQLDAVALGRQWQQNAVVWGQVGIPAQLLWCQ